MGGDSRVSWRRARLGGTAARALGVDGWLRESVGGQAPFPAPVANSSRPLPSLSHSIRPASIWLSCTDLFAKTSDGNHHCDRVQWLSYMVIYTHPRSTCLVRATIPRNIPLFSALPSTNKSTPHPNDPIPPPLNPISSLELFRPDSIIFREPHPLREPPEQRHGPGKDCQDLSVLSVGAIERVAVHPDGFLQTLLDPGVVSRRDILFDLEGFGRAVDDGFDELQRVLDLKESKITLNVLIICIKLGSYLHFLYKNQLRLPC